MHGVRAHLHNFSRGSFHSGDVLDLKSGQDFGFGHVGSDNRGAFQKFRDHVLNAAAVEQFRAAGGLHNWVMHNMGEFVGVQKFGDNGGVAAITEHSDLHGSDFAVVR